MTNGQKGDFVRQALVDYPNASNQEIKAIVEEWGKNHRKPGPTRPGDSVSLAFIALQRSNEERQIQKGARAWYKDFRRG